MFIDYYVKRYLYIMQEVGASSDNVATDLKKFREEIWDMNEFIMKVTITVQPRQY
jgi:hypothetical protein